MQIRISGWENAIRVGGCSSCDTTKWHLPPSQKGDRNRMSTKGEIMNETQRQGCRECGEVFNHTEACSVPCGTDKHNFRGRAPVVDSERGQPETQRHEFIGPSQFSPDTGLCWKDDCGQPREADIHRILLPATGKPLSEIIVEDREPPTDGHPMSAHKPARPCPFCGNQPEANSEQVGKHLWLWFECEHPACYINPASRQDLTIEDALRHWNTRSDIALTTAEAEIETLRAKLEFKRECGTCKTKTVDLSGYCSTCDEFTDTSTLRDKLVGEGITTAIEAIEKQRDVWQDEAKKAYDDCTKVDSEHFYLTLKAAAANELIELLKSQPKEPPKSNHEKFMEEFGEAGLEEARRRGFTK